MALPEIEMASRLLSIHTLMKPPSPPDGVVCNTNARVLAVLVTPTSEQFGLILHLHPIAIVQRYLLLGWRHEDHRKFMSQWIREDPERGEGRGN